MGKQHLIGAEGTSRMGGQRDGDQATRQTAALLARDPAAHAPLDNPDAVSYLLERLREAGAHEQAAALLARDPTAHATLDSRDDVASLLNSLRKAGADDQAAALVERLPAAGMFYLFRDQEDHRNRFRFGRETDGRPAEPWGWEDLDLWLVPRPQTCGTGAALSRGGREIGQPGHAALGFDDRPSLDRPQRAQCGRPPESQPNTDNFLHGTSRPTLRTRDDRQLTAAIGAENEEMT